MLNSIDFEGNHFPLIGKKRRADGDSNGNTYTVIVGKNGTGKSRLLRAIAAAFIDEQVDTPNPKLIDSELGGLSNPDVSADWANFPRRVIGLSTSPFDKFPLPRSSPPDFPYSYLGLRGLPSANLGLAYLSRIVGKLIEAIVHRPETATAVTKVLHYLRYQPVIDVSFSLAPPHVAEQLERAPDTRRVLASEWSAAVRAAEMTSVRERSYLLRAYNEVSDGLPSLRHIYMQISGGGVLGSLDPYPESSVMRLLRAGFLKLQSAHLRKEADAMPFDIKAASSGEQAVVLGLLGIGSQIQDDSLILIDEPEICLHPEWQERYIHLLAEAFSQYRGCHFIIATHSPQVIAELPEANCAVLTMEDGRLRPAREFSKRSADFQLASLFRAPGFRNEYLLRAALGVFADITKHRELDAEGLVAIKVFRQVFDHLQDEDPVKELISAILKVRARDA